MTLFLIKNTKIRELMGGRGSLAHRAFREKKKRRAGMLGETKYKGSIIFYAKKKRT